MSKTAWIVRWLAPVAFLLMYSPSMDFARADSGLAIQPQSVEVLDRLSLVQLAQAEGCPATGTTAVVFHRYVGQDEANAIKRTFAIPTTDAQGNPKNVYFTDCFYSDAFAAKGSLALPRKPAYRVEFTLRGVRARCPGELEAANNEPGGGNECILNDESEAIEIPDPGAAITPLQ
jgi:hypothetical protein